MLDQVIENINVKIRNEIIKPGMDSISLNYIITRNIPEFVKHFFNQEVEIWLREESEKYTSSERFSYDAPEIQMHLDKILDLLKQTATFTENQFNRLLERAVKLQASYLIRPHQTLTQFLFKDNFVITTIEIYDMLRYFEKFVYYKDAFTEYFNIKYMQEISQKQFEELIDGVDKQLYEKKPVEITLQTTKTIVDFLNEGRSDQQESIPIDILLSAYSDRKLFSYSDLISREQANGSTDVKFSDLERMLESGKTLSEFTQAPTVQATTLDEVQDLEDKKPQLELDTIEVTEEIVYPEEVVEEVVDEVVEEEEPEDETEIEEEIAKEHKEEFIEEEHVEETIETEPEKPEEVTPSKKISAADELASIMGDRMRGDQLQDLGKVISPKMRKKFVKKIFRKKDDKYQEFVGQLNQISQWRDASSLIDEYFMQEGVNPYSKEALELSDIIYNRYYPKDTSAKRGEF